MQKGRGFVGEDIIEVLLEVPKEMVIPGRTIRN
jgi:hypothetical protein